MQNNFIINYIYILITVFLAYYPNAVFAQQQFPQNQQVLAQEIFEDSEGAANTQAQAANQAYGPIQNGAIFDPEESGINAIEQAIIEDIEGNKQLIDLDIRSRPVYRYDTIIQPRELIDNSNSKQNSHLPKIYTNDDMKRILFDAIEAENIPVLQQLMNSGDVNFEMTDKYGNTLLDYAVKRKKYKVVKFLMYNRINSRNTRIEYMELALQYKDPNLIDIIEGVNPYNGDKFNESHVIRAMDIGFDMVIISDIYDELDDGEKYNLFNYYADSLHGKGLEFMAIQGYDLDRRMRNGNRVMEYGIIQGRYNDTDQLMWLKKYFSHNHVYSAYQKLTTRPHEDIKLAPQLASYGFNYDLTHDIRDHEYVIFCNDEEPEFDLDARRKIKTQPFVVTEQFLGNSEYEKYLNQSYSKTSIYDSSDSTDCLSDDAMDFLDASDTNNVEIDTSNYATNKIQSSGNKDYESFWSN